MKENDNNNKPVKENVLTKRKQRDGHTHTHEKTNKQ